MKNILHILLVALLPTVACKKDNESSTSLAVGKWNIRQQIIQRYMNQNPQLTFTYDASPGDYIEFKTDGTATSQFKGMYEPFSYSINGDNITINQSQGKINTLNSNTFSYTLTSDSTSISYVKVTWNLYK